MDQRFIDREKLARFENDVAWIKQEVRGHSEIIGKTADDVTEIKIMLAKDQGGRSMLQYIGHAAAVGAGAIAGFFSAGVRHI